MKNLQSNINVNGTIEIEARNWSQKLIQNAITSAVSPRSITKQVTIGNTSTQHSVTTWKQIKTQNFKIG